MTLHNQAVVEKSLQMIIQIIKNDLKINKYLIYIYINIFKYQKSLLQLPLKINPKELEITKVKGNFAKQGTD